MNLTDVQESVLVVFVKSVIAQNPHLDGRSNSLFSPFLRLIESEAISTGTGNGVTRMQFYNWMKNGCVTRTERNRAIFTNIRDRYLPSWSDEDLERIFAPEKPQPSGNDAIVAILKRLHAKAATNGVNGQALIQQVAEAAGMSMRTLYRAQRIGLARSKAEDLRQALRGVGIDLSRLPVVSAPGGDIVDQALRKS